MDAALIRSGLVALVLGLSVACGGSGKKGPSDEDTDPGSAADSGAEGDGDVSQGTPDAGDGDVSPGDGDGDLGAPDAGACITGCDEVGAECGVIDDGCGGTIDCDPEGDNCALPETCGGDPELGVNVCGCKPKTCADLVEGGAQCGNAIDDGCGGTLDTCGTCPGDQDVCDGFRCVCAPDLSACDGKVCGSVSDGCATVSCGANGGACDVGDCSADQTQCACPAKSEACEGKTGALTLPNGCSYDCTPACVADNAAACAGATCGTATNNCGDVVKCGASAGACASGQTCIESTYVTGTTVPARSGNYQGGLCVDNDVANLVGTYGVRTHAFRRASTGALSSDSRAEALSLVTITSNAAGTLVHMKDYGCAAKSKNFPGGIPATTDAPSYAGIAAVDVDLTVMGNAAGTGTWTRPIAQGGKGVPTGFVPGIPSYCVGKEGQDVDLPAGDMRSWFTDGNDAGTKADCRCPTAANKDALPTASGGAINEDCRVVDADGDGKPGFTVKASVPLGTATAYNVSMAQITWTGAVVPSGHHTGLAIEPAPIQRSTVGCTSTGTGSGVCSGLAGSGAGSYDCSCSKSGGHNFIQFAPLDGVADPGANGWSCADVAAQASTLFASFGSCQTEAQCPDNTLCTDGRCWPAATPGACEGNEAGCPANTECAVSDSACWPLASECPTPTTSSSDDCEYTVAP